MTSEQHDQAQAAETASARRPVGPGAGSDQAPSDDLEAERFTERGAHAEEAAYLGDGAYSSGDFAGGSDQPR